jgi:nitrogen fixation protein FixH
VTLKLNRPVGGHDDQAVLLQPAPDGYAARVTLGAGVWEALVQADDTPLGPFELHERFSVGGL